MKFDSVAWQALLNDVLPVVLCVLVVAVTLWVIRLMNPLKPPGGQARRAQNSTAGRGQ